MAHAIDSFFPKPLTHGVGTSMDEKYAECGCTDSVNPRIVFHLDVFEPHEGSDGCSQSHKFIAVRYQVIRGPFANQS